MGDADVRYCQNCGDPPTARYSVHVYPCGHILCTFCAKDGCMLCPPYLEDEEEA